ncbi:MAG: serine/threonine-protein phosphatase [Nitrospirae bacterium]|nr:serine/threonine-protein phosphatase [Candidatus Manganitrophaceae bacterium]
MLPTLWSRIKQSFFKSSAQARPHGVGLTDIGKKRSRNEDAILVSDDLQLYLVADGIGGRANGDIASKLAIESIANRFSAAHNKDAASLIEDAADEANRRIYTQSQIKNTQVEDTLTLEETRRKPMGTTLVALAIDGEKAIIAHAGDSRAYRLRKHHLERLTRDHSLAEFKTDDSMPSAPLNPRFKNVITRALGIESEVEMEIRREILNQGDLLLLCSDGLTHMVSDQEIETILTKNKTEASRCQDLVDTANHYGGKDNISCVLVRYE